MPAYGDFTSIAELGTGIGIGLSFFRAPIDKRLLYLRGRIETEMTLLKAISTPLATSKKTEFSNLSVKVSTKRRELERVLKGATVIASLGAAVNAMFLSFACLQAEREISGAMQMWYLLAGIGLYMALLLFLECIALVELKPLMNALEDISVRTT